MSEAKLRVLTQQHARSEVDGARQHGHMHDVRFGQLGDAAVIAVTFPENDPAYKPVPEKSDRYRVCGNIANGLYEAPIVHGSTVSGKLEDYVVATVTTEKATTLYLKPSSGVLERLAEAGLTTERKAGEVMKSARDLERKSIAESEGRKF